MKGKTAWIVGPLAVVALIAGYAYWQRDGHSVEDFAGTRSVEVVDVWADNAIALTDEREVSALVDAISLQRKRSCKCEHNLELVFATASGSIRASFCDHCFDIASPGPCRTYEMPPTLYKLLKPHVDRLERQAEKKAAH